MFGVLSATKNGKASRLSSVLVAVSGDPADDAAVRLGCEMLEHRGTLHLLYVIEVERGLPLDAEIAPATAKGEDVLRHVEEIAKESKREAEAELLQSRQAGAAVVQEAVDKEVDAIVLGVPYTTRFGSFSIGEAAPYVLKNAPCHVVLWRDEAPEGAIDGQ